MRYREKTNKAGTFWKLAIIGCLALMLVVSFVLSDFASATRAREFIYELHVYKMRALTTDPVGEIDFDGTPVINFEATPNITELTSYTQLSVWANSGESYYQASAGETVRVDLHAIYNSGGWENTVMSGITIHAPLATEADDERIFRVEYAILSGVSSEASATSGASTVYVYGAPSSAVTDFGFEAAGTYDSGNIQNLQYSADVNGLITPDSEITNLGDSKTWMLQYNSSVSAQITAESNVL